MTVPRVGSMFQRGMTFCFDFSSPVKHLDRGQAVRRGKIGSTCGRKSSRALCLLIPKDQWFNTSGRS